MADSNQGIIQAINLAQYRQAQVLIQKKIKKYPTKSYYHALNCLCLLKSGKESEAITEANQLKSKIPSDPDTLLTLADVFNEVGDHQSSLQVYENAVKKYPSHDLIYQWFSNALSRGDIRTLQKATMSLQKVKKSLQYTYWAAFAYILVSELPDATVPEKTLYPKIAIKLIQDLKPLNEQQVFVHVKLLDKNGDKLAAIKLIKEFSQGKTYDLELQILLILYLNDSEDWEQLAEVCEQVLFTNKMDDFDTWKFLLKALTKLDTSSKIIHEKLNSVSSRNSYLARIEYGILSEDQEYFDQSLINYYEKFKVKLCCFNDLKYYHKSSLFDNKTVLELIKNCSSGFHSDDDLNTHVNNQKLKFLLGNNIVDIVEENFTLYQKFTPLLKKKETTDYFAGDEFILMNVQYILQNEDFSIACYKAVILLEHAMSQDKHESRLKLMAMKIYNYLNLRDLSIKYYQDLKIKMIQSDTLGYTINSRISSLNPTAENCNTLTNIQKFYLTCVEEVDESLINAFDKNTFNKLKGFIEFGQRINHSIGKWINTLELLRVTKAVRNQQVQKFCLEAIKVENLHLQSTNTKTEENRDFTSVWKFGKNDQDNEMEQKLSVGPIIGEVYLKAFSIINLILEEPNSARATLLLSQLNKLSITDNDFTTGEIWVIKLYIALFKLYLVNPKNTADSNFLIKNLQLNSIKPLRSISHPWESNHVILLIYEFCKNVIQYTALHQLPKAQSSIAGDIKKNVQLLLSDLRDFEPPMENIAQIKDQIIKWDVISKLEVNTKEIFEKISDYQKISTKSRKIA